MTTYTNFSSLCNVRWNRRFPFNWKTPIGYSIAIIWQTTSIFIPLRFFACMLTMALGWYFIALSLKKDWNGDLRKLRVMVKTKQSKAGMTKLVTEFVRSHSNMKQLSESLAIELGSTRHIKCRYYGVLRSMYETKPYTRHSIFTSFSIPHAIECKHPFDGHKQL